MLGVDPQSRRFTVRLTSSLDGNRLNDALILGHDDQTRLMLQEVAVPEFRVTPGSRLLINTAPAPNGGLLAGEVLDEVSAMRLKRQQELRLVAQVDVAGASAVVQPVSGAELKTKLSADYAPWLAHPHPGAEMRIGPTGGLVLHVKESDGFTLLSLTGAAPGPSTGARLTLFRVPDGVYYNRDIRPLLSVNCLACHGSERSEGGYNRSTPEGIRRGDAHGRGIVKGKSDQSPLYLAVSGGRTPRMPPDRPLTPEQLTLLRQWIDHGASYEVAPE